MELDVTNEVRESCAEYRKLLEKGITSNKMPKGKKEIIQLAVNSYFMGIAWGSQLAGEVKVELKNPKPAAVEE